MGMPLCFIITWQFLSYAWLIIHLTLGGLAWGLERRLRRTEDGLRALEDLDTLSRWGQVSQLSNYTDLSNEAMRGLAPEQIKALPESRAYELDLDETSECSICLNTFSSEDPVRQLGSCGHCFHRACIDLWLLRCAECPLCKQSVLTSKDAARCSCVTETTETVHWHV